MFDPLRTQGVTGMPEVELRGMGSLLKLDSDLFWVASSSTPDTLKHDRTGLNNVTSDTMNTNSRSELELLLPGIAQLPRGQYLDGNNFAEVWGGGFSYSGLDYQGILLIFFAPDSSAKVRILWDPSYLSQEYSREVLQSVVDMIKLDQ